MNNFLYWQTCNKLEFKCQGGWNYAHFVWPIEGSGLVFTKYAFMILNMWKQFPYKRKNYFILVLISFTDELVSIQKVPLRGKFCPFLLSLSHYPSEDRPFLISLPSLNKTPHISSVCHYICLLPALWSFGIPRFLSCQIISLMPCDSAGSPDILSYPLVVWEPPEPCNLQPGYSSI